MFGESDLRGILNAASNPAREELGRLLARREDALISLSSIYWKHHSN
jgi:hypothetical protein